MKHRYLLALIAATLATTNANAFGLNDLLSIGFEAGGKLVGAAVDVGVDKVKDAMRDPDAEARQKAEEDRKLAAQYQKQVDDIEAMPNLRPLDRERLIIALGSQYEKMAQFKAFAMAAEEKQREQRSQIFTAGGLAGVVGEAALHTPSMVVARADMMVKAGIPQAQARAAIAQADISVASGIPQAAARSALVQAEAAAATGAVNALARGAVAQAEVAQPSSLASRPIDGDGDASGSPEAPVIAATKPDAFAIDVGKKVFAEFFGSPSLTAEFRRILSERGHTLAADAGEADVVYRIEGEYVVSESGLHGGLTRDAGGILEAPDQAIPAPEKKTVGSLKLGIAQTFFGISALAGTVQGKQMPAGVSMPKGGAGFKQQVLLVAARVPKDGKETRVSIVSQADGDLQALALTKWSKAKLFRLLGLPHSG